jgi:hypothetical protein
VSPTDKAAVRRIIRAAREVRRTLEQIEASGRVYEAAEKERDNAWEAHQAARRAYGEAVEALTKVPVPGR